MRISNANNSKTNVKCQNQFSHLESTLKKKRVKDKKWEIKIYLSN